MLFFVVIYFVLAAPKARAASFDFAERVGRGGSWWRRLRFSFGHFYTFGLLQIDRLAALSGQSALFELTVEGEETIRAAHREGRGVILETAHIGNWEMMMHLLSRIDANVTAVMFDGVSDQVKEALSRLEENRYFSVIYSDGTPTTAAAILAALSRGDIVGIMGDRLLSGNGAEVRFLDTDAEFPVGPYVLAAASGAPLMHTFSIRVKRRQYAFTCHSVGRLKYQNRRRKQEDLQRWAQQFADRVAEYAARYPHQWGNFHPIGKTETPS